MGKPRRPYNGDPSKLSLYDARIQAGWTSAAAAAKALGVTTGALFQRELYGMRKALFEQHCSILGLDPETIDPYYCNADPASTPPKERPKEWDDHAVAVQAKQCRDCAYRCISEQADGTCRYLLLTQHRRDQGGGPGKCKSYRRRWGSE